MKFLIKKKFFNNKIEVNGILNIKIIDNNIIKIIKLRIKNKSKYNSVKNTNKNLKNTSKNKNNTNNISKQSNNKIIKIINLNNYKNLIISIYK